jgi:hypothetical protein
MEDNTSASTPPGGQISLYFYAACETKKGFASQKALVSEVRTKGRSAFIDMIRNQKTSLSADSSAYADEKLPDVCTSNDGGERKSSV